MLSISISAIIRALSATVCGIARGGISARGAILGALGRARILSDDEKSHYISSYSLCNFSDFGAYLNMTTADF
jgi:hypothetical protein